MITVPRLLSAFVSGLFVASSALAGPGADAIQSHPLFGEPSAVIDGAGMALPPNAPNPDADQRVVVFDIDTRDLPELLGGFGTRGGFGTAFVETGDSIEGDVPSAVVFSPDGGLIYIAHRESQNIIAWNAATRAFVQEFNVDGNVQDMAITPDGVRAVTANLFENTASVINLNTGTQEAVIPVGGFPGNVRITPDGTRAVVANGQDNTFSVINLATNMVERTIAGASLVSSLSFNFESGTWTISYNGFELVDNSTLVHAGYFNDTIVIADILSGAVTTLPAADAPRFVGVSGDGSTVLVTHPFTANVVTVVDVPGLAISRTIAAPETLWGPLCLNNDGSKAVITVQNACRVLTLGADTFSASLNTASVNELYTTADGLHALCVGFRGSLISYATSTIVRETNNVVSGALGNVSPTDNRGAMCSTVFGDDLVVVDTNGAAGGLEAFQLSGPTPEGDRCRASALTPDGATAVAVNIFSDSANIIDVATGTTSAWVSTGMRPGHTAITPDGTTAVIANLDDNWATVVNMDFGTWNDVVISRRGDQVQISPDGQYAYIAVVADGDGVWRINLNTVMPEGGKVLTGNMGSVGLYYSQSSGMTLSPDGNTLVTCGSFSTDISIIDTAAWSEVLRLPVGPSPIRAAFKPDNSEIYIADRTDDTVRVVNNLGVNSFVIAIIPVGDNPSEMALTADGSKLYVLNASANTVSVINTATRTVTATIPLPNAPVGIAVDSTVGRVYVTTSQSSVSFGGGTVSATQDGSVEVIDIATDTITDTITTGLAAAMASFNGDGWVNTQDVAALPCPNGDGLVILAEPCPADFNGDGTANGIDVGLFLQAYSTGNLAADMDDNGTLNGIDVGLFLQAYAQGC